MVEGNGKVTEAGRVKDKGLDTIGNCLRRSVVNLLNAEVDVRVSAFCRWRLEPLDRAHRLVSAVYISSS